MILKKAKVKKPRTLEKTIQAYFIQIARLHNFYCFRSNNNRVVGKGRFVPLPERDQGQPDAIVAKDGNVWFVEFKSTNGKQSPMQKERQKEIEAQGCKYVIISSILEVTEFVAINK